MTRDGLTNSASAWFTVGIIFIVLAVIGGIAIGLGVATGISVQMGTAVGGGAFLGSLVIILPYFMVARLMTGVAELLPTEGLVVEDLPGIDSNETNE